MRIRIDAHHAATKVERRLVPAPIKVKPPRICVDFNGDAVFGAGREDFLDIDVVPRTAQKLASGHMPKDGGIGIGDRADDALGLRRAVHFKLPVNACDDEIEAREHVFRIIERAVSKDVRLDAFKDTERAAVLHALASACCSAIL